jgi:uncharacterized membrane protein YphA (DoxX/SURF4 family)
MNTLTTFPSLLDYLFFAPSILRLAVSLFILSLAFDKYYKKPDISLVFYVVSFILLFLGWHTQIASIIAIGTLKLDIYRNYWSKRKEEKISKNTYFLYGLAGIILLSLLATGPGAFAFDLPL